jgi:transglutaminase-like putative cysteine protease
VRLAPADDAGLRAAVAVVGASSVLALWLGGLLGVAGGPALVALAVSVAVSALSTWSRTTRAVLALALAAVVVAAGVVATGSGDGQVAVLSAATAGVLALQQSVADTRRELGVTAVIGIAGLVFALGMAPSALLLVPLLTGWTAVVAALVVAPAAPRAGAGEVLLGAGPATAVAVRSAARQVARWTALTLVVAVVLVLLVPPPGAVGAGAALAGLTGRAAASGQRSTEAYSGGDLDLRLRGTLPSTPLYDVPLGAPDHWRLATLDVFDGSAWRSAGTGPELPVTGTGGDLTVGTPGDGTAPAGAPLRTDDVTPLPGASPLVIAPGAPRRVQLSTGSLYRADGGRLVLGGGDGPAALPYTVTSAVLPRTVSVRAASPVVTTMSLDLALPVTTTARTRALAAELTAGRTSVPDRVAAVEDHLRSSYRYQLDSPVPPPGQDAVDHFLFDAGSGFCEQFATAEVVLLRSLGITARLATGFAFATPQGDHAVLTSAQAHAWVEVDVPGVGWTTSDPTPASLTSTTSPLDAVRAWLVVPWHRVLLAGVLVLLTLGVALALRGRARRPEPVLVAARPRTSTPAAVALFEALVRLSATAAQVGRPAAPGETLDDLAARVPELPAAVVHLASRAAYARREPRADHLVEAAAVVEQVRRRLDAEAAVRA